MIAKPKLGHYPIALIPGQFVDYYRELSPAQLAHLPLNTTLKGPPNAGVKLADLESDGREAASEEDSDSSSDSDSDSDSSSGSSSSSESEVEEDKIEEAKKKEEEEEKKKALEVQKPEQAIGTLFYCPLLLRPMPFLG